MAIFGLLHDLQDCVDTERRLSIWDGRSEVGLMMSCLVIGNRNEELTEIDQPDVALSK